ncbi:MAG: protein kinase [Pyrinomonadaceae bacterium]|nr:protein kinase [Pyrinomonadaceae bacterium]
MPNPIDVFCCYAPEDEALRVELDKHLASLQRSGLIRVFSEAQIGAGEDWQAAMARGFAAARVILLLVSPDFLALDDARWKEQVVRAIDRHRTGTAQVIPILVRACDWSMELFSGLKALPANGVAITRAPDRDHAWAEVVAGIRAVVDRLKAQPLPSYQDEATERLCAQIELERARRQDLLAHEIDTAEVDRTIRELRRQLREGGQLRAGDALGSGRYLLLRQVGRGGFAIVWEAHDRERNERVAVKVLHSNLAGDRIRHERFFRGARTMAELGHPAVVRVLEQRGEDGGYHYFVMEFIAGDDLRQAVLKKALSGEAVIPVILRVGEALSFAHQKGLVHRDVKPANILLDTTGSPRLTDFDLVGGGDTTGGTRTGALGTVVYTAPEITDRPQDADARADVYSLGMTAVFALHGAELSLLDAVRYVDRLIDKLRCSDAIKAVLKRAVDIEKEGRFADAGAFCEALREARSPRLYG